MANSALIDTSYEKELKRWGKSLKSIVKKYGDLLTETDINNLNDVIRTIEDQQQKLKQIREKGGLPYGKG